MSTTDPNRLSRKFEFKVILLGLEAALGRNRDEQYSKLLHSSSFDFSSEFFQNIAAAANPSTIEGILNYYAEDGWDLFSLSYLDEFTVKTMLRDQFPTVPIPSHFSPPEWMRLTATLRRPWRPSFR